MDDKQSNEEDHQETFWCNFIFFMLSCVNLSIFCTPIVLFNELETLIQKKVLYYGPRHIQITHIVYATQMEAASRHACQFSIMHARIHASRPNSIEVRRELGLSDGLERNLPRHGQPELLLHAQLLRRHAIGEPPREGVQQVRSGSRWCR